MTVLFVCSYAKMDRMRRTQVHRSTPAAADTARRIQSCIVSVVKVTEADDWRRSGVLGAAGWAAGGAIAEMNVYGGADGCTVLSFALSRHCSFGL